MIPLELIHFNDVYHVAPSKEEPVGGASRFTTRINEICSDSEQIPLVLFSGDAFNPSLEGTVTRGSHMPEILNQFGITAACLGNHDFDFGMPQLAKLIGQTRFPWLLSNVLKGNEAAECFIKRYLVIEHEGLRIGLIGLVEKEWILTIPSFPPDLVYHDFVQVAQELSQTLRDPEGEHRVDIVIALTHMRVPNDVKLAESCKGEIDLVLGGHDHFYYVSKAVDIIGDNWNREINLKDVGFDPERNIETQVRVVKSGTDFREFSHLKLEIEQKEDRKYIKKISASRIIVESRVEKDETTEELVNKVTEQVATKTNTAIGYTTVPLDGRSMSVRTKETNLGNFTADMMVMYYQLLSEPAELGFCVGGTIRNDSVIEPGEITFGDILTAFPFTDPVVVIRVSGQQIWDALENSVSEYPKQEGRFPQLANIRLEWNPDRPSGSRVRKVYTVPHTRQSSNPLAQVDMEKYKPENMEPLDLEREYIVATRHYLVGGYDGYDAFKVPQEKMIVDEESGVLVSTLYRRFFLGLKYINAFREFQAEHKTDRFKKKIASIAAHWKQTALYLNNSENPKEIDEKMTEEINKKSMCDIFVDSGRGHPHIADEEDEAEMKGDVHQRYQELCQIPSGDKRVDSPTGEKYQVMKAMSDQLGLPGTPAADILSKMGKPNEMTASLDQENASIKTMPGPVIPETSGESTGLVPYYLVYNLIPKKLFLFFKIDPVKETVITSDWQSV